MKFRTKTCPRCNSKNSLNAYKCDCCGLIFERLNDATNSAGKKMIISGHKNKVVYVKKVPKDIKKWKLILITIFGGMFGAHCFYVGRYLRGVIMLLAGVYAFIASILAVSSMLPTSIYTLSTLIVGILVIVYLLDIVNVCISKFKIPVYIDNSGDVK